MTDPAANITIDPAATLSPFSPSPYPPGSDSAPLTKCAWQGQAITFQNLDLGAAVSFKAPSGLFDATDAAASDDGSPVFRVPAGATLTLSIVADPPQLTCYQLQIVPPDGPAAGGHRNDVPDQGDGKINVGTKPTY